MSTEFKVSWPTKYPNQIGRFGVNLVNHLASNEAIATPQFSVLVGNVSVTSFAISGTSITAQVSGGTSGPQQVLARGITNLGNEIEVVCEFEVIDYPTA